MTTIRPKSPRIALDPEAYAQLRRQVLERDHWRCQNCGSLQNLQVHHQQLRSQSGSDVEDNLITLCEACHRRMHRNFWSLATTDSPVT
jgi:5-methylcytosine-specific restriction endonuclease McrA